MTYAILSWEWNKVPKCNGMQVSQLRSNTNQTVQPQKMARGFGYHIKEVEGLYYVCSDKNGADQLLGHWAADLRLCFRICKNGVSHDAAHIYQIIFNVN